MKIILSIAAAAITFTLASQVPANGLVSSYPFTGNSNDASGNNNNLTPFNGPTLTTDRFGNANCAYLFDGLNDYFTAPNPGPLLKKSRSLAFWAKTNTPANSQGYAVLNYGDPNGSGSRFEVGLNSSCNNLYLDLGNGYAGSSYSNTSDNTWHFYVVTYDSTISNQLSSVKYYVDAVLTNSYCIQPWAQNINTINNLPVNIGRFNPSLPRYFNGSLDDIHFYNQPLNQAEITGMFNPCSSAPSAPVAVNGNSAVCSGKSYAYSVTPVIGATSYSWSIPGGWSGSSNSNSINVVSGSAAGVISVASSNGCGQSAFISVNVTSNASPTVTAILSSSVICNGNSTNLSAAGANTYTWNNGSNSSNITVSPTITTQYTVTGVNAAGCSAFAIKSVSVTNNTLPTIVATGPSTLCSGQTANLAANGALTYTWQPGNFNGFFVTVNPTVTTTYTITGTDNNGCYNSTVYTQYTAVCTELNQNLIDVKELSLFPNPTTEFVIIRGINSPATIEFYNVYGAIVIAGIGEEGSKIDLTEIPEGVYFVRISTKDKTLVKKLIKE